MKKLYRWQKITIWVIGVLTIIAVTYNDTGKELNIGYLLDIVIGVGSNILILWLLFVAGNWIYKKYNSDIKNGERKN